MKTSFFRITIILFFTAVFSGCGADSSNPITLSSWKIDETNTGLKGDYSNLTLINPEEVGSLAANTLSVSKNDITISDKQIPYTVIVTGTGVRFERCRFQPVTVGQGIPLIRSQETRAVFSDCEMDFSLVPIEQAYMSIGITLCGEIYRCNIHGSSTGIYISNNSSDQASVAEGNLVHGLRFMEPAHVDGLTIRRCDGTGGMIIRNNYIRVDPSRATGALFIQAWGGHIDNVLIEGNFLQGYGHCLALEYNEHGYGSNMRAINNRFDAWTVDGGGPWYTTVAGGDGWAAWEDNYVYDEEASADDYRGAAVDE